jgi:hypothetical protein
MERKRRKKRSESNYFFGPLTSLWKGVVVGLNGLVDKKFAVVGGGLQAKFSGISVETVQVFRNVVGL